jgi:hypothetical protein
MKKTRFDARGISTMGWSKERIRFAGALVLFLVWIALLAAMAIISSNRPADRRASTAIPTSSVASLR